MSFHPEHNPVLVVEVVEALSPKADAVYLDATFGRGGYSRAILDAAPCEVIAIDRDPDAIAAGQSLCQEYGHRLTLLEGRFSQINTLLASINVPYVDGVVFDFGFPHPN